MHQELHLAYFDSRPDLSMFDVKQTVEKVFFDVAFTFRVIGDSHYIEAPEIGVYELLSCKPIPNETTTTVELTTGETEHIARDVGDVHVGVDVIGKPLSVFAKDDDYDVKHQFGSDAFTTIKCVTESTYNTCHTYPEYNLALYTENTFTHTDTDTDNQRTHSENNLTVQP